MIPTKLFMLTLLTENSVYAIKILTNQQKLLTDLEVFPKEIDNNQVVSIIDSSANTEFSYKIWEKSVQYCES